MSYAIEAKYKREGSKSLEEAMSETALNLGTFAQIHAREIYKGTTSAAWTKVIDKALSAFGAPVYLIVHNTGTTALSLYFGTAAPDVPGDPPSIFEEHVVMPGTSRPFELPNLVDVYIKTLAGDGAPL